MPHTFTLSLGDSLLFDVFCSLAVHRIYNKYEVNPANIPTTLLLLLAVPALPCYFLMDNLQSVVLSIVLSYVIFCCVLAASIVLYRVSPMHPLAKYPGPILLKISKIVGMYYASSGKQHIFFKRLHDKYGPFVRIGPNELSVSDAEAIPAILEMRKGPMWEVHILPGTPPDLSAIRNVKEHVERRKLWNYAFTTASLKDYQPVLEHRISELIQELGKRVSDKFWNKETPLDLAQWLAGFTYDTAGDIVWGQDFGLMKNGAEGGVRAMVEGHAESMSILHHTPWIMSLIHKLAAIPEGPRTLLELVTDQYERRRNQGAVRKDIFHFITSESSDNADVSRDQGVNDVLLAILGGTDTTSTVMSGLFFYLLSNHDMFARLRDEVDTEFPSEEGDPFDAVRLSKMPYLNAVINEVLRLQPAVPTAVQRSPVEGSGGKFVNGSFIPEGTAVYVPPYVLHRDPRYFSPSPDSFIPERWLDASNEKFTTNTSAFIPFSSGYANCVGKNLAWMEMRMAVAAIVQRFDMKFAEGYDPCKWEEELQDFFAVKVGQLPVLLFARE